MKIFQYLLIFLVGLTVSSCSISNILETPNDDFTNKLLINGALDKIKFAEMQGFTKLLANKNYKYELIFYTGTTSATYTPTPSYSGVGSYFKFSLWSQDSTIASGTYIIDGYVNNDFSISQATTELNVDWTTGESEFGSYLDGSVQIENLGNGAYKIDIACTDYEGMPVSAFYEGEFYRL